MAVSYYTAEPWLLVTEFMNYSLPVLEYNCEGNNEYEVIIYWKQYVHRKEVPRKKDPTQDFTILKDCSKNFISNKIQTNKEGE